MTRSSSGARSAGAQPSHRAREIAESFGTDPERYDRTRPRYPDAMVRAVVAASPGRDLLDVGIGTGIAARQFRAAGCEVLGVDVDARMADYARAFGIEVEVAKFEDWDAAGRTFDAVIAGQTWHWVEPDAGATKAAAVLRPRGRIALFWNVFEMPEQVRDAVASAHRRVLGEMPFLQGESGGIASYIQQFAKAADGIRRSRAFDEPEQWRFDWEKTYSKDEWLDQVPGYGGYNRLAPEQLERLLAELGAVADSVGGTFVMHYATVVVTAVVSSGAS